MSYPTASHVEPNDFNEHPEQLGYGSTAFGDADYIGHTVYESYGSSNNHSDIQNDWPGLGYTDQAFTPFTGNMVFDLPACPSNDFGSPTGLTTNVDCSLTP
jgi:hypothetical protein